MKRKLTRKDFAGLRQYYPVLSQEEMRQYVGGLNAEGYWENSDSLFTAVNPYATDFGVTPFSSSSYGYGDWDIDGGELPEVVIGGYYYGGYDAYEGYDIDGGELPEVVIGGSYPDDNENWNPEWDYYDPWPDDPDFDSTTGNDGYYDMGYWYEEYDGDNGNTGGSFGGGSGSSDNETNTSEEVMDKFTDYLMDIVKKGITESAEAAHNVFEMVVPILAQYPEQVESVKDKIDEAIKYIEPFIEDEPNEMGWGDLFSIWLFELETSNLVIQQDEETQREKYVFVFDDNAKTTKDLQTQEGVLQAKEKALLQLKENNLSEVNHSWSYDVPEFVDGIKDGNLATSFLGSYNTTVEILDNQNGTYTFNYTVTNTSGWESATRLRVSHDKPYHDGIIPNCERDTAVGLGGTITEQWTWSETIKID